MTETTTLKDFIAANNIRMTATRTDRNPHNPDWRDADHWRVTFVRRDPRGKRTILSDAGRPRARMTTYFSMGYGHNGAEPEASSVLSCLADDAHSVTQSAFEEWARDLGYAEDSRKAERIYKACEKGAEQLKRFLGDELFEQLLYSVGRD